MATRIKEIFAEEMDATKDSDMGEFGRRIAVAAMLAVTLEKEDWGFVSTEGIQLDGILQREVADEDVEKLRDLIKRAIKEVKGQADGEAQKWN